MHRLDRGRNGYTSQKHELIELLARIDQLMAYEVLFEIIDHKPLLETIWEHIPPHQLPHFVVHIDTDERYWDRTETTLNHCLVLILANEGHSTDYHCVKKALLDAWRIQHPGQAFDRETDGRVNLSLRFYVQYLQPETEQYPEMPYVRIASLARAHSDLLGQQVHQEENPRNDNEPRAREDQEHVEMDTIEKRPADQDLALRLRGPFSIDSFRFNVAYHPATHFLDCLNQIASLGMPLSHVTLSRVLHDQLDESTVRDFLVRQLAPRSGSQGIRALTFDHIGLDADDVRTFCTTIARSQSLQEFSFIQNIFSFDFPTHVGTDVWWPWLAYAVFSRAFTKCA